MNNTLQKQPWYLLLLPLFFVLHGYSENFGFINLADVVILGIIYLTATILCYLFFFFFFRDRRRTALVTFYTLAVYFFFGAIQDFLKIHFNTLNKYSVLLGAFLAIFIVLFIYLKRNRGSFLKLTLFLNSLFLVFIITDAATIFFKKLKPPADKLSVYSFDGKTSFSDCTECAKPDIYFLLFDEYASSASLEKDFNYDNGSLDTFLSRQGFQIQRASKSNYNFTPFSMASLLNMSYLTGVSSSQISIEDYARCNELIRNNLVINFLSSQGYDVVNYSIFDLAGNPTRIGQEFLPLKTRLISDATLFARMRKDLGWMLFTGRFKIEWLAGNLFYQNRYNNETILNGLVESSLQKQATPRFFYAHLFMPHPPFYFDEKGNLKKSEVIHDESKSMSLNAYLEYVTYTNTRLHELISAVMNNTQRNTVIVLMGDHGFRKDKDEKDTSHYFAIQNAVYFPAGDYHLLYDSVSAVNQFRIIFNTLFKENFPILKDSTIFLMDKK